MTDIWVCWTCGAKFENCQKLYEHYTTIHNMPWIEYFGSLESHKLTTDIWEDLWDETAFNFLSYSPDELVNVPGIVAVNTEWLKRVKAEGISLKEKLEAVKTDTEKFYNDEMDWSYANCGKCMRAILRITGC